MISAIFQPLLTARSLHRHFPWILLFCAALPSCGSGSGGGGDGDGSTPGVLDCMWLMKDNCWKSAIAALSTCLPASRASGKLSADGKTCAYNAGPTISFDDPLKVPLPTNPPRLFRFTVANAGQQCVRYEDMSAAPAKLTLTTAKGKVVLDATSGLSITCPDGHAYSAPDSQAVMACAGPGGYPHAQVISIMGEVNFSLWGTSGMGGRTSLWDCASM